MSDLPVVDMAAIERLKKWGGNELSQKMVGIFLDHAAQIWPKARAWVLYPLGIVTGLMTVCAVALPIGSRFREEAALFSSTYFLETGLYLACDRQGASVWHSLNRVAN